MINPNNNPYLSNICSELQTFASLRSGEDLELTNKSSQTFLRKTAARKLSGMNSLVTSIWQNSKPSLPRVVNHVLEKLHELEKIPYETLSDEDKYTRDSTLWEIRVVGLPTLKAAHSHSLTEIHQINFIENALANFRNLQGSDTSQTDSNNYSLFPFDLDTFNTQEEERSMPGFVYTGIEKMRTTPTLNIEPLVDENYEKDVRNLAGFGEFLSQRTLGSTLRMFNDHLEIKHGPLFTLYMGFSNSGIKSEDVEYITDAKKAYNREQAMVIPIVFSGFVNHVTVIYIKDGQLSYYDSQGIPAKDRMIAPRDSRVAKTTTMRDFLEKFEDSFELSEIKENSKVHQSDSHNCGGYVLNYIMLRHLNLKSHQEIIESSFNRTYINELRIHLAIKLSEFYRREYNDMLSPPDSPSKDFSEDDFHSLGS